MGKKPYRAPTHLLCKRYAPPSCCPWWSLARLNRGGLLQGVGPRTLTAMNQANVMLAVIETSRGGAAMRLDEAISSLSAFIARLDTSDEGYEDDMEMLVRIGACIWESSSLRSVKALEEQAE
jgi:hypothetical protein